MNKRTIAVLLMSGIIGTAAAQGNTSIQTTNLNGKTVSITTTASHADSITKADTIRAGRKTDTTEIKVGKTRIVVIGEPKIEKIYLEKDSLGDYSDDDDDKDTPKKDKKVETDWFNMDLGINSLLDDGKSSMSFANRNLELNGFKSTNFTLYIFNTNFDIIHDYVRFSAGLGLDYNNYRLSKDVTLVDNQDSLTVRFDTLNGQPVHYDKNKLLARYVVMPLMLEFNTKNGTDKCFHIAGGVELGYLINGRLKQVSGGSKQKVNDDFNMRDFRYGFVGRVGYGDFSFYGKYYPESLFADNQGPDLNTVCFGVSFGF